MNIATQFVGGQINTKANIACLDIAAPVQTAGAPEGTFHLTPEALLNYCSSRLDSIDQKIKTYFDEQQKKNVASKQLGDLQAIVGRASSQKAGKDFDDNDASIHAGESNEILKIYRDATDPKVKEMAAKAFTVRSGHDVTEFGAAGIVSPKNIMEAKDKIVAMDSTQWAQRIEDIKSEATSVSKGAELNMIQLQSFVSQRQLAVQLTTQLMQSVNESMKNITANVRG